MPVVGAMQPSTRLSSNDRFKIQERSLVVAALAGRFCPETVIGRRRVKPSGRAKRNDRFAPQIRVEAG